MKYLERLSWISILLHWIIAITIIGLIVVGLYMSRARAFGLFDSHKSIGVVIFVFALLRVVWRIWQGWPEPVAQYPKIEQVLAKAVHWILIVATVGMPISGMMNSGIGGHGFGIFGLELVSPNHRVEQPDIAVPYNKMLADLGAIFHHYCGYVLIATIALHAVAAFKHHLVDRDGTLLRMLGRRISLPSEI